MLRVPKEIKLNLDKGVVDEMDEHFGSKGSFVVNLFSLLHEPLLITNFGHSGPFVPKTWVTMNVSADTLQNKNVVV